LAVPLSPLVRPQGEPAVRRICWPTAGLSGALSILQPSRLQTSQGRTSCRRPHLNNVILCGCMSQVLLAVHAGHAGHVRVHGGDAAAAQPQGAAHAVHPQAAHPGAMSWQDTVPLIGPCTCGPCTSFQASQRRCRVVSLFQIQCTCAQPCTCCAVGRSVAAPWRLNPRTSQRRQLALQVYRQGQWEKLPGDALLPGDVISIGRPQGALEF